MAPPTIANGKVWLARSFDRKLSWGVTHRYVISAVDSNGEGAPSQPITVLVPKGKMPGTIH